VKTLLALVFVSVISLVSCSQENLKAEMPAPAPEKGGALTADPGVESTGTPVPFGAIALDGNWKTKCIDTTDETTYKPYIAEILIGGGVFRQKWTSYSDNKCTKVIKVHFSTRFQYSIGDEVSPGVRKFDYFWNYTDPNDNENYQGEEFNILSATDTVLKFHPVAYEIPSDEFDGSTPAKRFQSFLNTNLGYVEEYVRQ